MSATITELKFSEAKRKAELAVGTTEYPPGTNRTIFALEVDAVWPIGFSRNGAPWCGTFCEWLLGHSVEAGGMGGLLRWNVFSVIPSMNNFKSHGLWSKYPEPGFLCFQSFGGNTQPTHVGWVKDVISSPGSAPGLVDNIEGNTSINVIGHQDNGGGVYQRTRTGSSIVGYGVIKYKPEGDPSVFPYLVQKSPNYRNVYAHYSDGVVRGLTGINELAVLRGQPGVTYREDASEEEIQRAHAYAGGDDSPDGPLQHV